jgi:type I restriction enzyme S subunit
MLEDSPETVFSGFVLRARPKDDTLDDAYKQYCFTPPEGRYQIVSKSTYTTRALTNGRLLSAVYIAVPPLPEQTAIAAVLSDMDAEIAALERRREKAEQIKQGMMQQLLTGRIRLPSVGGVSTQ